MYKGYYGIDPRKLGVTAPRSVMTPTRNPYNSSIRRYNPYQINKSSFPESSQQRRASYSSSLSNSVNEETPRKTVGKIIDQIFELSHKYSISCAMETALVDLILCRDVYVWFNRLQKNILYSPTLSKGSPYENSILSFAYKSKEIILCDKPLTHNSYNAIIDGSDQLLYVPLINAKEECLCVLQFRRHKESPPFTQDDVDIAASFTGKFKWYIKLLFPRDEDPIEFSSVLRIPQSKNPFSHFISKMKYFFSCKKADIFLINGTNSFAKFIATEGEFKDFEGTIGVATEAANNNISCIVEHIKDNKFYDESFDGTVDDCIAIQPFTYIENNYIIVLRCPERKTFSNIDSAKLLAFSAMIGKVNSQTNMSGINEAEDSLANSLQALLYVAEVLSGVLDIDALIPTIMTKACELLNAERCSLFLIDHEKNELVTRFQGGLNRSLRIPLSRGIVGYTATTGNIVNIDDPYADPRFDQTVDRKTGYHTRNLVCVPILNNRGEISGVTEMINKIDDGPFNEDDLKMLLAFNVFCGISLDNARLYRASLNLTKQLRSFIAMSDLVNSKEGLKDIMPTILSNAKRAVHATRATIFLVQDNQVTPFVNVGKSMKHGSIFAEKIIKERQTIVLSPDEVDDIILESGSNGGTIDHNGTNLKSSKEGLSSSRVSLMFKSSNSAASIASESNVLLRKSICLFPLFSSSGELLGVLEVSTNTKVMPEDTKLVECFAVFASISLERSELKEIATLGAVEKQIKQYMTAEEREEFTIPEKMKLNSTCFLELGFDAASFEGVGFFKVIFEIFNHFDLLKEFQITNEKFFKFLDEISNTYKKVPYHNWRHAVDVTQYIAYELEISGIVPKLTKLELLGLLVAAICHDANHDGFSNVYNVKAETPLGILFKNQSVMETHHCAIAISVITKDETNIFSALSPEDYKKTWSLIIKLILNTDMAKHFTFLKEVNALMDEGKLSIDDPDYREYYLHLILKCADISNVSRPFNLANRWCDVLCEEFFRQGDLEAAQGMEYTSDLNDRAHLDKPKSQIGFYTFVCLPLYKAAQRALPKLKVNADQIESNLQVWKKQADK